MTSRRSTFVTLLTAESSCANTSTPLVFALLSGGSSATLVQILRLASSLPYHQLELRNALHSAKFRDLSYLSLSDLSPLMLRKADYVRYETAPLHPDQYLILIISSPLTWLLIRILPPTAAVVSRFSGLAIQKQKPPGHLSTTSPLI